MNLKRCENGHFYNPDEHNTCPFCEADFNAEDNYMPALYASPDYFERTCIQEDDFDPEENYMHTLYASPYSFEKNRTQEDDFDTEENYMHTLYASPYSFEKNRTQEENYTAEKFKKMVKEFQKLMQEEELKIKKLIKQKNQLLAFNVCELIIIFILIVVIRFLSA